MNKEFTPEQLFDLSEFPFRSIFDGTDAVWEVLKKLDSFVKPLLNGEKMLLGQNSKIHSSAVFDGLLVTGKNCEITDSVLIRGICILGDNVKIGHAVELKNTIILNGSSIAHLNYVGDAVIGNNVNISGGAMLANFRLDKKNVTVKFGAEKIDTGLEKFSAAIGDGSTIGVNAVLNPGTILGKDSLVMPLISVSGVYRQSSVVK